MDKPLEPNRPTFYQVSGLTHHKPPALASNAIAGFYQHNQTGKFIRANLITTLNGTIAIHGRSEPLGSPSDKIIFSLLRQLSDVIIVGARTALAEHYRPITSTSGTDYPTPAKRNPSPRLAVVSGSLALGPQPSFLSPVSESRTIILTGPNSPHRKIAAEYYQNLGGEVIFTDGTPLGFLTALTERYNFQQFLLEGGPHLFHQFLDAELIHELALTVAPVLAAGPNLLPTSPHAPQKIFPLGHKQALMDDHGFIFWRWQLYPTSEQ